MLKSILRPHTPTPDGGLPSMYPNCETLNAGLFTWAIYKRFCRHGRDITHVSYLRLPIWIINRISLIKIQQQQSMHGGVFLRGLNGVEAWCLTPSSAIGKGTRYFLPCRCYSYFLLYLFLVEICGQGHQHETYEHLGKGNWTQRRAKGVGFFVLPLLVTSVGVIYDTRAGKSPSQFAGMSVQLHKIVFISSSSLLF